MCRYCLSLNRLQGERFENWWQKILSKCIWFAFTWIPLRPKINVPKLHFSVQAGNLKLARIFFFSLNLFQNLFTGTFTKMSRNLFKSQWLSKDIFREWSFLWSLRYSEMNSCLGTSYCAIEPVKSNQKMTVIGFEIVRSALLSFTKGGFYSEGTDAFVISSNRQTLLFSWAWILNLWYFRGLKWFQIRAWCSSEAPNSKMETYLRLQSHFRPLFDMIWAL